MILDCLVFPEGSIPRLIKIREEGQDVSFEVDGEWRSRRAVKYFIEIDGEKTPYLLAIEDGASPSEQDIRNAIKDFNPDPYPG